ncbi:MAG: hypothetical protein SGPRY_005675 [Prymnesium sp.]
MASEALALRKPRKVESSPLASSRLQTVSNPGSTSQALVRHAIRNRQLLNEVQRMAQQVSILERVITPATDTPRMAPAETSGTSAPALACELAPSPEPLVKSLVPTHELQVPVKAFASVPHSVAGTAGACSRSQNTSCAREVVGKLISDVQALMEEAQGRQKMVVTLKDASIPSPRSIPYNSAADNASVISWSADAFGKSKTPNFYHQSRKEIAANRRALAAKEHKSTFYSHSKYADEATRIANTGRLAF